MDQNKLFLYTICIILGTQASIAAKLNEQDFIEVVPHPFQEQEPFYIDEVKSFVPKEPVIESDDYAAPILENIRPKARLNRIYKSLNRAKKTMNSEEPDANVNFKERVYVPPPRKSRRYLPPPGSRSQMDRSDGLLSPPMPEVNDRKIPQDLLPPPENIQFIPPIPQLLPPMMEQQKYLPPYMQVSEEKYLPPLNQEYLPAQPNFNKLRENRKFNPPKEFSLPKKDQPVSARQESQDNPPVPENRYIPSEPENKYLPSNDDKEYDEGRFILSQPENGFIPDDSIYMPPNAEKELMDNDYGQKLPSEKQSEPTERFNPPQYNPQEPQYQPRPSNQYLPVENNQNTNPPEAEKQYIPSEMEKQYTPPNVENQYLPPTPESQYLPPSEPNNQYLPSEEEYAKQYEFKQNQSKAEAPKPENEKPAEKNMKQYKTINRYSSVENQSNANSKEEQKNLSEQKTQNQNLDNSYIPPNPQNQYIPPEQNNQYLPPDQSNQYIPPEQNNQFFSQRQSNQYIPPGPNGQYTPQDFNNQYLPPEQNNLNAQFSPQDQNNQYLPPTAMTYIENQYLPVPNEETMAQYNQNFIMDPTQPTNDTFIETPMATRRYDTSMFQFSEMLKTQPKTPSPLAYSHHFVTLQDGSSRSDLRQFAASNSSVDIAPKEIFINGPQIRHFSTPEPYYGHNYKNINKQIAMSRSSNDLVGQESKYDTPTMEQLKQAQAKEMQNHMKEMEEKLAKLSTLHSQDLNQQLQAVESRPVASFTRNYVQPTPFSVGIHTSTTEGIPILKQSSEMALDGSFSYETLTGDQTHMIQQGHIENPGTEDEEQVIHGSYSYIGSDGVTYTVHYVADGNGFRASGDHLPTPPPVPEIIQRAIEFNLNEEAERIARDLQKYPNSGPNYPANIQDQIREKSLSALQNLQDQARERSLNSIQSLQDQARLNSASNNKNPFLLPHAI